MDSNPFDNKKIECYTAKTFGECIKRRREQLNISLWEMAKRIGMSPAVLGNIEQGQIPAPSGNYLYFLEKELCLTYEQREVFNIMAEISYLNNMNLIDDYIINNPYLLKFLLNAFKCNWTNEQWRELYNLHF